MKNSIQLRIRLPRQGAEKWLDLPPTARAKAVALVLGSAGEIDLKQLVGMRRELVNLGTLLNQSLEASCGRVVDGNALKECVTLIKKLTP
jgi:hypothetical protein